ncbi:MAG: MotA/TolQ/ExbB proton channel family protein [Giesbergeria sp.]|uniref:MotA/TolQ/ExbB proton channel family protein n=1 Tax=Giesbergeria sp. TaxID=2818473 RepID=UPI0026084C23|nr:MotA/TolQ/ExbB proton channel family protein [Giesbergeria sp.]MDD2609905.1 MotA/TolQ/ExbB proton channel family protein [Giesbergeria sp.]
MGNFLSNQWFTWGINLIFFLAIGYSCIRALKIMRQGGSSTYVEYAPSLMTSLGLFGTFVGILIGLLNFDTKHIDSSIPTLLEGLKTAFITSIIGMAFAIFFKIKQTNYIDNFKAEQAKQNPNTPEEVGPKEIHNILTRNQAALVIIAKGIGGNDERSLVAQLQILRTEIIDLRTAITQRQEKFETNLWGKLDKFAEMLSKSATQQVIDALRQVIVDFNQKLTEQFGENFKRLDDSVKKLVDWQENYKEQLNQMIQLYRLGTESIESTNTAVASIRTETARIPEDMQLLNHVLTINQHQIDELTEHIEAFVAMRDQAVLAVPQLQQKVEEIGLQLVAGSNKLNSTILQGSIQLDEHLRKTNEHLSNSADTIAEQVERIAEDMFDALKTTASNTDKIRTEITDAITESLRAVEEKSKQIVSTSSEATHALLAQLQKAANASIDTSNKMRTENQKVVDDINATMVQNANRSLQAVEKQVQEVVKHTNEAVNSQLRQLDEALSRQLNAALTDLGSSLASIANHLMQTYQQGQAAQKTKDRQLPPP